jgi:nucleotide-binding universal stress UspA family protein
MSASSFRHVLALLDDSDESSAVLERAVELADAENARLTLAKFAPSETLVVCVAMAPLACAVPVAEEVLQAEACRRLADAAELVPASIPLTTVLLRPDAVASLRETVERGGHDLLVATRRTLDRSRKLRRAIRDLGISTLTVSAEPEARERLLARLSVQSRSSAPAFRRQPATNTRS